MPRVSYTAIGTIGLVVLAVGSLGLLAATVDSVAAPGEGPVSGPAEGDRADFGSEEEANVSVTGAGSGSLATQGGISLTVCLPVLRTPPAMLGIGLTLVGVLAAVRLRTDTATAGLVGAGLVPLGMLGYFLLTNCHGGGGGDGGLVPVAALFERTGGVQSLGVSPAVIGLVFVGVAVGAGALLVVLTGAEDAVEAVENDDDDDPTGDEFARAASRAVDRIEETTATTDNAVYGAWVEMISLVDVDGPETTPPREFGRAAVDAGLAPEDVEELTQLFTAVRYGGEPPEEYEQRALAVFRNIKRTYQNDIERSTEADA